MKILDKYILKKMLTTFGFIVVMFITIICVIDYVEKSDSFTQSGLGFGDIFVGYFLNFMPYMANLISPITVFITAVFVTAQMASRTEIIAILNGGISYPRLLLPFIGAATIIGIIVFFMIGWVIPNANKRRMEFEVKYIKEKFFYDKRDIHFKVAPEAYVYMESYNNTMHVGYQFSLEKIVGNQLTEKLKSSKIAWNDSIKKWHIDEYQMHTFNGSNEKIIDGRNIDTTLNFSPSDFENNYMRHETFTNDELDNYIALLKLRGSENVATFYMEKYERFAYPFAIVILTFMGVVMASTKKREGAGVQIAIGFVLAFAYILCVILSRTITTKSGVNPILGAWIPNLIFFFVSAILYFRVRK